MNLPQQLQNFYFNVLYFDSITSGNHIILISFGGRNMDSLAWENAKF